MSYSGCYKLLGLSKLRWFRTIPVAVTSNGEVHRVVIVLGIVRLSETGLSSRAVACDRNADLWLRTVEPFSGKFASHR